MKRRGDKLDFIIYQLILIYTLFLIVSSLFSFAVSQPKITLTVHKSSAFVGEEIKISYSIDGDINRYDYIALVPSGDPFLSGYPWASVKSAQGDISLKIPPNVESVQFIYHSGALNKVIARSNTISVSQSEVSLVADKSIAVAGEPIKISWSVFGETNKYDYVALVHSGKQFVEGNPWMSTNGTRTGSALLIVPPNVNSLQSIYYSEFSKKELARSNPIEVELSSATLTTALVAYKGQPFEINWSVSGVAGEHDYIAIVHSGKQFVEGNPWKSTNKTKNGTAKLLVPDIDSIQVIFYSSASGKEIARTLPIGAYAPNVSATTVEESDIYAEGEAPEEQVEVQEAPAVAEPSPEVFVPTSQLMHEENTSLLWNGYIVELKSEPLAEKETKLKELAKENEEKIKSMSNFNPLKYGYILFATTSEDVPEELEEHREDLDKEKQEAKEEIKEALGKEEINLVTGNSVAEDENALNVINEYENVFNGIALDIDEKEAEKVKELKNVKAVYPNLKAHITLMDSVPIIKANEVWKLDKDGNQCLSTGKECLTGKGIRIGIIDTGVDYTHPDLGGCFGMGCKVENGYDFVNNDNDPMDDSGHGTHVAATAAGNGVLKGVAPEANIVAYKVLDAFGSGTFAKIIAAIERSVDPNQDGNFSDHLDIISISIGAGCWLGGYSDVCGPDDSVNKAIDVAVEAGILAVVAAGNEGPAPGTISSPGTSRKAITVGATDKGDSIAIFSGKGPVIWKNGAIIKPDIVAPGVEICAAKWDNAFSGSECLDTNHIAISGTSMATPHVSGAAALIKQAHPEWKPTDIKLKLRNAALKLNSKINSYGYGRLDSLNNIVQYTGAPPTAILQTSGQINSATNVIGSAYGSKFVKYMLYLGQGLEPIDWILLHTSNVQVENGVLFSNLNPSMLFNGNNMLKLVVESGDGQISEDRTILITNKIEINNPISTDVLRFGDKISIYGSIRGTLNSYIVEYAEGNNPQQWLSNGISLANQGKLPVENGLIGVFDTSVITNPGFYTLRLTVNYGAITEQFHIKNIYLDSTLKKGWPQRIELDFFNTSACFADLSKCFGGTNLNQHDFSAPNAQWEKSIDARYKSNIADKLNKLSNANYSVKSNALSDSNDLLYFLSGNFEPGVADLDNDGLKEIIVYRGTAPPDGTKKSIKVIVYEYNGSIRWIRDVGDDPTPGQNLHSPVIADLDNDGFKDVIIRNIDWQNSIVEWYAFDRNGNLLDGFPVSLFDTGVPTFIVADLDHDGANEIIVKSGYFPQKIMILDNKGNVIAQWNITDSQGAYSYPAIGDFDDDADFEIVVTYHTQASGYNPESKAFVNEAHIAVYNMDGTLINGWPVLVDGLFPTTPTIGDINYDGKSEIIVGFRYWGYYNSSLGGLYAFDRNGNIVSGWPVLKGNSIIAPPSFIESEYNREVVVSAVTSSEAEIYVISHSGDIKFGWPVKLPEIVLFSAVTGDVNSDDSSDIVAAVGSVYSRTDSSKWIYAWNLDGSLVKGFPKITEFASEAPPTITDIDDDGMLDLVASSDGDFDNENKKSKHRGSVYAWDLGVSVNEATMHWPTFMHDIQRTSMYKKPIIPNKMFCNMTAGNCNSDSARIISVSNSTGGHVSKESNFMYNICCNFNPYSLIYAESDLQYGNFLFSLSNLQNDAHISLFKSSKFPTRAYISDPQDYWQCTVRSDCKKHEVCLFSVSNPLNNAHVASCHHNFGFYSKYCCKSMQPDFLAVEDIMPPIAMAVYDGAGVSVLTNEPATCNYGTDEASYNSLHIVIPCADENCTAHYINLNDPNIFIACFDSNRNFMEELIQPQINGTFIGSRSSKNIIYTLTQSSAYRSCTTASYSTMTDNNGATLAGTNSNNEWIKATFPAQVVVKAITVGGGGAEGCWGNVAAYLNNAVLQYSTDDNNWVTALTINGVTDSGADQFKKFTLSTPITARYWRLYKSNWFATSEFRFE